MKDIQHREDIILLVNSFYDIVKEDIIIGDFFNNVAKTNWSDHLPKMYDFWEGVLFGNTAFKGNPMQTHIDLDKKMAIEPEHFSHWLYLFFMNADELFEGPNTEKIKDAAASIADVMAIKVAHSKGQDWSNLYQ